MKREAALHPQHLVCTARPARPAGPRGACSRARAARRVRRAAAAVRRLAGPAARAVVAVAGRWPPDLMMFLSSPRLVARRRQRTAGRSPPAPLLASDATLDFRSTCRPAGRSARRRAGRFTARAARPSRPSRPPAVFVTSHPCRAPSPSHRGAARGWVLAAGCWLLAGLLRARPATGRDTAERREHEQQQAAACTRARRPPGRPYR